MCRTHTHTHTDLVFDFLSQCVVRYNKDEALFEKRWTAQKNKTKKLECFLSNAKQTKLFQTAWWRQDKRVKGLVTTLLNKDTKCQSCRSSCKQHIDR